MEELVRRVRYSPFQTPFREKGKEEEWKKYLMMTPGCFKELFKLVKDNNKKTKSKKKYKYAGCNPTLIETC